MNRLLIDAGNSRIKWAWQSEAALRDHGVAALPDRPGALGDCLPPADQARPDEVRLVSTAGPERTAAIVALIESRFRCRPWQARSPAEAGGLRNGYATPGQLGADRWLAMRGARALNEGAICVVDAGTATTVDLVSADGRHQGGVIVPGLFLMQASLRRSTGDLDRLAGPAGETGTFRPPPGFGGRSTAEAIRLGCFRATAALIARAMSSLEPLPVLVLTGGHAAELAPWLDGEAMLRPDLVLEGLALAGPDELVPAGA